MARADGGLAASAATSTRPTPGRWRQPGEGWEETGLDDLAGWPDPDRPSLVHVAVVPVPVGRGEPAHEHVDLRYLLATERPERAVPERPTAPLRWLPVAEALEAVGEDNLRVALVRVAALLGGDGAPR